MERLRRSVARFIQAEPQELRPLAWSFGYFFCLLCGYYILRPVRDEMAIQGGVHNLPWMMTGTFAALLAVTPLFGWLSARYSRYRLLLAVYGFFIVNLIALYFLMTSQLYIEWVARGFFVWLSVFNLFVVSIFWSFMADLFTPAQGARLFGVIAAGGSTGALFGPLLTTGLTYLLPVPVLMLVSAVFLSACIGCIYKLEAWSRTQSLSHEENIGEPLGGRLLAGIRLVWASPYLLGICGYLSLLTMTATFLYLEQVRSSGRTFLDAGSPNAFILDDGFCHQRPHVADPDPHHEPTGGSVWSDRAAAVSSAHQSGRFSRHCSVARTGDVCEFFSPAARRGVCVIETGSRSAVHGGESRRKIQGEEFHRYRRFSRR